MKYKLINLETQEEHLCDKVTLDGFDYFGNDKIEIPKAAHMITHEGIEVAEHDGYPFKNANGDFCFKVIATTDPNLDIPKIVDEVEELALLQYPYPLDIKDKNDKIIQTKGEKPFNYAKIEKYRKAFVIGYTKAKETYQFTEQDIIEFIEWVIFYYPNQWKSVRTLNTKGFYSTKELFALWKEQQPITLYFKSV